HDLLNVSPKSTCDNPIPLDETIISTAINTRRGGLGTLQVTKSNLETPIPMIDIVNENLEFLAANLGNNPASAGVVYDTAGDQVAGHLLRAPGSPDDDKEPYHHDPAILFGVLPEHSSPATPVKSPAAYDKLRDDFSAPLLPYDQPIDVNRTYLGAL